MITQKLNWTFGRHEYSTIIEYICRFVTNQHDDASYKVFPKKKDDEFLYLFTNYIWLIKIKRLLINVYAMPSVQEPLSDTYTL